MTSQRGDDPDKAYRQAYNETKLLLDRHGKSEILRLLTLNRIRSIAWQALAQGENRS